MDKCTTHFDALSKLAGYKVSIIPVLALSMQMSAVVLFLSRTVP